MENFINDLKIKGISFQLEYYGETDYTTYYDMNTLLENESIFLNLIQNCNLTEINTLTEYTNYLLIRKLSMFNMMLSYVKRDEDKSKIEKISNEACEKCKEIENASIIKYINKGYSEIFSEDNYDKLIFDITLNFIIQFKSGIKDEVFIHLANEYNFLLLDKYNDLKKFFENKPELFKKILSQDKMEDVFFNCENILPIYQHVLDGKNQKLKDIIIPKIDMLIEEAEVHTKKSLEITDISLGISYLMTVSLKLDEIYEFLCKIKHVKANEFDKNIKLLKRRIKDNIGNIGTVISYKLNIDQRLDAIRGQCDAINKSLLITHDYDYDLARWHSLLENKDKSKSRSILDLFSSNLAIDDYFTRSHQHDLEIRCAHGTAIIKEIWIEKDSFLDNLSWCKEILNKIDKKIEGSINLEMDIVMLQGMLSPIISETTFDDSTISSLCYGASMFLCALIDKVIRSVYIHEIKKDIYIPLNTLTLGSLLNDNNENISTIFGKNHIKNLCFFLTNSGNKKIGKNIRNNLAHWIGLEINDLDISYVAKLFYLYTDVINTIYLFYYDAPILNEN